MTDSQMELELNKHSRSRRLLDAISSREYYNLVWRGRTLRSRRITKSLLRGIDFEASHEYLSSSLSLKPEELAIFPRVFKEFHVSYTINGLKGERSWGHEDISRIFKRGSRIEILTFVNHSHTDRIRQMNRVAKRYTSFRKLRADRELKSIYMFSGGADL